jgi:hypothetical protein
MIANEHLQLFAGRAGAPQSPAVLKIQINTFFGGDAPWSVVVPNARLIGVVNDAAIDQPENEAGWRWLMAQIPLTTEPADPKDDKIPLMGLATSFFVRQYQGQYVFEFDIFHVGPWRADPSAAPDPTCGIGF